MSKNDDKKIIRFPSSKERKRTQKQKERGDQGALKDQERLEDEYRRQYRKEQAQRATLQSKVAQGNASGKVPFINWDRLPIFTRWMAGAFLFVQILLSVFANESTHFATLYYFGFVPGMYTGATAWSWSAVISPFTTLILHSGWMHTVINCVMMVIMGTLTEKEFGAKQTALFFLICGMAGNLVYFLFQPTALMPVVGASGAISGLFALGFMVMIGRGRLGPDIARRGPLPFVLMWGAVIIGFGFLSSDVSWQSHLGGFLGGIGLFYALKRGRYI